MNNIQNKETWFISIVFFNLFIVGCSESIQTTQPNLTAEKSLSYYSDATADQYDVNAVWIEASKSLKVSGNTDYGDVGVEIHDASDGVLLGTAIVALDGTWSTTASTPACAVHVSLPSGEVTRNVEGTPVDCQLRSTKSNISERALTSSSLDVSGLASLLALPESVIVNPSSNVVISTGDVVNFAAQTIGGNTTVSGNYFWNFDGGARNSSIQNPGPVQFNSAGIYQVELSTVDATGVIDPTPAIRMITVLPVSDVADNSVTLAEGILLPAVDLAIRPGQSVYFSAQAPADATSDYVYSWTFDGASPSTNSLTPGNIIFKEAGQYVIDFNIMDSLGNIVGKTDSRIITVLNSAGATPEITPIIVSPTDNTEINGGQRVVLMAALKRIPTNPILSSVNYKWEIKKPGNDLPIFSSSQLKPEPFIFNEPGRYYVSLQVNQTDSLGNTTLLSAATSRVTATPVAGPDATFEPITYPTGPTNITNGDILTFQSGAISDATNLSYQWDFDGNALPSTLSTPPPVMFSQLGTYMVSLDITGIDASGTTFRSFGQREVYVNAAGSIPTFPPQPQPAPTPYPPLPPIVGLTSPESVIDNPVGNISLNVGQSVVFAGRGFDPLGGSVLRYEWDFNGAVPNSITQNPGLITFNLPGVYSVNFVVINDNDVRDPTPASVLVTVSP